MSIVDTIQPPPPPSPTESEPLRLGLWVQMAPDVARSTALLELGPISTTVGRGTDVTHTVLDSWLSREHFRISLAEGGVPMQGPWLLEDLGTRNGTLLNGLRVDRAFVRLGDVVRAGGTVMVLDVGSDPSDEYGLVGASPAMAHVRTQIRHLGPSTRPVHITGESGVGKELVARALHAASGRTGPFLGVNMANIVASLAESQLFGHRRGAFSGAQNDQQGAFDVANGGTLLLDEIAELEPALQAKLLRVTEAGEVHRIGDARPHAVDTRLVTATHRDLAELAVEGKFRADLYWRIGLSTIDITPLRERVLDVVPLVEHFLIESGVRSLRQLGQMQPADAWQAAELVERMLLYDWPGNVRELREEVRRLADAMRARLMRRLDTIIPPMIEACSPRLLNLVTGQHRVRVDEPRAPSASAQEIARYNQLLTNAEALAQAIQAEAHGNVKDFAERVAAALGRHPGTVRRQLYRVLGGALGEMRKQ